MSSPIAEINLKALHHNFAKVRELAPTSKILVMLKANAYGHGLLRMGQLLKEADAFAVARLDEALILRRGGVRQPIVVMMGFLNVDELKIMIEHDLQTVVHSQYQLDYLENVTLNHPLTVWFKLETGLSRLGFSPQEATGAYQRLMACNNVKKPLVLLTHFACANDPNHSKTPQQLTRFQQLIALFQGEKSIARSSTIILDPQTHMDWVRPGIMIYGASPFADEVGSDRDLQPVMTMKSQLISVKQVLAGETVGYGGIWTCDEDMLVGVVAFGYADGYPRHTEQGAPILINGVRCPLIGRVSMDMLTVDLRQCLHARVGDEAILWGKELPIELIAQYANTTPYTIWVNVSLRVQFVEK